MGHLELTTQLQARKELTEVLCLALRYLTAYDASNPDVGMGPSTAMLFDRILSDLSFTVSPEIKRDVLKRFS